MGIRKSLPHRWQNIPTAGRRLENSSCTIRTTCFYRFQPLPHVALAQRVQGSSSFRRPPIASESPSCPWTKSSMHFVHLKTSGFLRVLRTLDRIVRSNTWFIHSLLARLLQFWCPFSRG